MNRQEFETEVGRAITEDEITILAMLMPIRDMCMNDVAVNMECDMEKAFAMVLPLWQLYLIDYPQTVYYIGITEKGRQLFRDVRRKSDDPRPQVYG